MDMKAFAEAVSFPVSKVHKWLTQGYLTPDMLNEDGVQEFVSLRRDYMVDGCPYFTAEQFSRAAGMSLGVYRKGDKVVYNGRNAISDIPVHHTVDSVNFYSAKTLREWLLEHDMLSYISIQKMLDVDLKTLGILFKCVGWPVPENKLQPYFSREAVECAFVGRVTAFAHGMIYDLSYFERRRLCIQ